VVRGPVDQQPGGQHAPRPRQRALALPRAPITDEARHDVCGPNGRMAANGTEWKLRFDVAKARSEAVHVNTLGYVPSAPTKYAYVYHWMGDQGGLDVRPLVGCKFQSHRPETGQRRLLGQGRFPHARHPAGDGPHVGHANGNFLGTDVAECDFSVFSSRARTSSRSKASAARGPSASTPTSTGPRSVPPPGRSTTIDRESPSRSRSPSSSGPRRTIRS